MQKHLKSQVGNSVTILTEQVKENFTYGKSQHFTKIKIKNNIKTGELVKCMVTNVNNDILFGHLI